VILYLDQVVVLGVHFEEDSKKQSWKMACGLIQQAVIHHAPGFVKYHMKEEAIHIRPEDKT